MRRSIGAASLGGLAAAALWAGWLTPAYGGEEVTEEASVTALSDMGLLDSSNQTSGTGALSIHEGLTVSASGSSVSIVPVSASIPSPGADGRALLWNDDPTYSFVVTGAETQADAAYAVIMDPGAPTEYRFSVEVDGKPASLVAVGDRMAVLNNEGAIVNVIAPAWAKDANGTALASSYRLEGNVLVQSIDHRKAAAYPVVADPRLQCNWLNCTVELTRGETLALANNTLNVGIACALTGPLAAACAAVLIAAWAMANVAVNTGQCVGVRFVNHPIPNNPHAVYVPCYA